MSYPATNESKAIISLIIMMMNESYSLFSVEKRFADICYFSQTDYRTGLLMPLNSDSQRSFFESISTAEWYLSRLLKVDGHFETFASKWIVSYFDRK